MKIKFLLSFLLAAFMIVSCQKDSSANLSIGDNLQEAKVAATTKKLMQLINENKLIAKIDLEKNQAKDVNTKLNTRGSTLKAKDLSRNADFSFYKNAVKRVINPNDYQCGPTILDDYIPPLIANWTNSDFFYYAVFSDLAFLGPDFFYNTQGASEYYGANGEYTNVTNRSFRDLKRFWNIPTDIIIGSAHGSIFKDVTTIATWIQFFYVLEDQNGNFIPVPYPLALEIAETLKIVFGSSRFQNYNHPLLTFNAFADWYPPLGIAKKIIMGDGIQKAYDDLGFGDVAPQAIIAHEYGHHIQFALNVDFGFSPEGTRRTELMADAYSAYYLTHKRGAAMNWRRVQEFLQVFYSIGDCGFGSLGHHGTPNQRMKAAAFGYKIANDAQKQGKILTSEAFLALFDAALPAIVAPDAF
jgi:hypothetical protein